MGHQLKVKLTKAAILAKDLLRAAENECLQLRDQALQQYQAAYQLGLERGLSVFRERLLLFDEENREFLEAQHHRLLDLVRTVATEVIGAELKSNPNSIHARISNALNSLKTQTAVELKINPATAQLFQDEAVPGIYQVTVDPNIQEPNFKLSGSFGEISSDLSEHRRKLFEQLSWQHLF